MGSSEDVIRLSFRWHDPVLGRPALLSRLLEGFDQFAPDSPFRDAPEGTFSLPKKALSTRATYIALADGNV